MKFNNLMKKLILTLTWLKLLLKKWLNSDLIIREKLKNKGKIPDKVQICSLQTVINRRKKMDHKMKRVREPHHL